MRRVLWLLLPLLLSGCVQTGCLGCDDGNPCTADKCVEGKCVHTPLEGPVLGCSGSGGCIEYGCFSGECLPQKKVQCCGNGLCDLGENYMACPRDCQPTCYDGMMNQGEESADCGGPCPACEWSDIDYLRKIGHLRGVWYDMAQNYTKAINSYNTGKSNDSLMVSAMEAYGDLDNFQGLISKTEAPEGYGRLGTLLNDTVSLHMEAIHNMVLYLKTGEDRYRMDSNRLFSDAIAMDRTFTREYNRLVDGVNAVQAKCSNYVRDEGEESVDCGGICRVPCEITVNVTKYVTVKNEGSPARMTLNVSTPAIDYPMMQSLIGYRVRPIPDERELSPEGNLYYVYEFNMPAYGVQEFEIIQTVTLRKLPYPVASENAYFSPIYLIENNNSRMTKDICFRADTLKSQAKNMSETASNTYSWMSENIAYEANTQEFGAEYCFTKKAGACDEQADLFVSLARCAGVPARRVTGNLLNASQITGHAWAEYYDGRNWIYLDPSVRNRQQAFVSDNKHLASCVGEGAYHCGIEYAFTYTGKKPKIEVKERVYLS